MVRITGTISLAYVYVVGAQQELFQWQPCAFSEDPRLECGSLRVPLNHLHPSVNETIDIAVRRYRVENGTQSLGTILVNPGGPGHHGTAMASAGLATYLGGQYDVLGFDPRGVGLSRPARCTKNGYTSLREWPSLSNLPFDSPTAEKSLARYGASLEAIVRRCEKYDGQYLKYLSTAFVARDMDLIRAALNESVVNYYGVSYGSTLGATYANMYPNRVGRFVIDSVLDPTLYTGAPSNLLAKSTVDADETFDGFADACEKAGPLKCPLAYAAQVGKRVRAFLAGMVESPLLVPAGDDFSVLTAADVRANILNTLYRPGQWLDLAHRLHSLMEGMYEASPVDEVCPLTDSSYLGMGMEFSIYIGNDGDSERAQDWHGALREAKRKSPLFGMQFASYALPARYWKVRPIERYSGPWNTMLRQPILILQNKLDPVTPLRSARALAKTMGTNAVLVTRDGFGHETSNTPSKCIQNTLTAFFSNGTYPKHNSNCKVDMGPFDGAGPHAARRALADKMEAARQEVTKILTQARQPML
ncbi:hypothetical protein DYB30_007042 [Aphanomyces astaci]|uniref:AB hydrolase-1 domain-containing protein n=1 Tax=Aphanomyces astaci TaxID=112090 RepID=A0A397DSA0_APHAT|nr:hypothetical protein DYB30_007042 [Aphanomyces astaci]